LGYATALETDLPKVSVFLKNVTFTTEEAEAMSYAIDVEQRAPADVAAEWIDGNSARWKEWLK
ncbi:MAG: glycine betaine ABC transporter substrate-binding protein, partial [Pseudomonadota bacterium]